MSKQEDLYRPEKPLEKTREIDNEARISNIQLSSLISLLKQNMAELEISLPDCHKMTVTALRMQFNKVKANVLIL